MIAVAPLPAFVRSPVRLLWMSGALGLAVFVTAAAGGPGDVHSTGYEWLYATMYVVPAALCLLRAVFVAGQRDVWAMIGAGMLCWAIQVVWFVIVDPPQSPSYPSASDALWLAYYGLSFTAILRLIRSGLPHIRASLWIDAIVGGLAVGAIAAVLLVDPIQNSTAGSLAEVITNVVYPLIDVVIVGLLIGVFVATSGRPGRIWAMLSAIWLLHAAADTIFLYQQAAGTYAFGTILDAAWPALMLALAVVAWHRPVVTSSTQDQGWGMLAVTGVFATVGLAVLTVDHWHRLDTVPLVLATLTLVAAFLRTAVTFAQLRSLADNRALTMRTDLILDAAGEGIAGTDADGNGTFMNPAATRLTGYAPDELIGRSMHDVLHHTRSDGTAYPVEECPMRGSVLDGQVHHCERDVFWRKDGTSFAVEYTSTPIVIDGVPHGAVVVFRDITARRELQRTKDEFTSVVSHELRTPLTSIRGSLGLLEGGVLGVLPDRAQRMIQIAVQNTDRLVRLINDILDLERLDSEAAHVRLAPCDAAQLIARAADAMLPTAVIAGVTLTVDSAPAAFDADADGLLQTLTNLIGNAVKFSYPGGTVQISSQRRNGELLFTVRDGGRGIPPAQLESIFGRFAQVDSSDSRQSGGTGLGLAISRSIVERHGGRIWATSAPGAGSTFSFVVPAALELSDGYEPRSGGERGSVLICDDNAAILEVTGTALTEHGYRVILAHTGAEAIEQAIAERPDVILLDLVMPGLSGEQTATALREHPLIADIPIVVLSVLPRSGETIASSAFADWIEKPAAPSTLFDALERAINRRDDAFRVLVVERDPAVAELLAALFARHGVTSYASTDGPQALDLCAQVGPDLLVLDSDLPDVDGVDIKQWLRGHARLGALPITAYDADAVEEAERERRSAGSVTQMLTRDQITPEEFQWRVMTLLARPRTKPCSPEGGA